MSKRIASTLSAVIGEGIVTGSSNSSSGRQAGRQAAVSITRRPSLVRRHHHHQHRYQQSSKTRAASRAPLSPAAERCRTTTTTTPTTRTLQASMAELQRHHHRRRPGHPHRAIHTSVMRVNPTLFPVPATAARHVRAAGASLWNRCRECSNISEIQDAKYAEPCDLVGRA